MLEDIQKHPSDIAKAAIGYLQTLTVGQKTRRNYEDVFFLFIEHLRSDPSAVIETKDGDYLLKHNWNAYYGGVFSGFLDWWLPQKVMNRGELFAKAPRILRSWVEWCYENKFFDKKHYEDFVEALPKDKKKSMKRLEDAADLLYRLHSPNPGAWMTPEKNKVVSMNQLKQPDEVEEGYMELVKLDKDSGHLINGEERKIGPVKFGADLVTLLKVGDVMNVTIGRYGKSWRVLESGNVYAEGVIPVL